MKKKTLHAANIGTITLMMIFIILCMITFAVLSVSSAVADERQEQKLTDHITEYYTASNKAEEMLAQADAICSSAYAQTDDGETYYRLVEEKLKTENYEIIRDGETFDVSYQLTVNDSQALYVLIRLVSPGEMKTDASKTFYRILSWQMISTDTWEGDNTLTLIK